jgi:hypothetical protein
VVEWAGNWIEGERRLREGILNPRIRAEENPAAALRLEVVPEIHPDDLALLTVSLRA